jgi:type I restriction enzyme S subunit
MTQNNLPKDWKIVISSDIMDIRDGTHDTPKYVNENGIPLITSKNLKGNEIDFNKVSYISNEDHFEISKRSKVESGDILFAMIGTIGNPAIIKGDANFSIKNVGLFKKNESVILPQFFVNFLRSSFFEKQLNERRLLKGTTQKFIPLGNLRKIEIPFPPIETQQAIVSKIEELFSELDKGIEDLKTAQLQLKTYRQSVLKWAFEGKLTNENVKEGKLPEGWSMAKMSTIIKLSSLKHKPEIVENLFYIGLEHIEKHTGKLTSSVGIEKITTIKNKFSIGDILYGKLRPNLNKVYLSKEEGVCSTDILVLKLEEKCIAKYLHQIMISRPFVNEMSENTSGVNLPRVSTKFIMNYEVPLPPVEEQHRIVQEIESRLSVADKMEESIAQSLQQAEALRQSILKKAFSGELV